MAPAIVRLVAQRRFPELERQARRALVAGPGLVAGLHAGRAGRRWSLSVPLWLVPPLVLVLPPLIWGWLTCRVIAFDVLALHASAAERRVLLRRHRWRCWRWAWSAATSARCRRCCGPPSAADADLRAAAGAGVGVAVHAGVRLRRLLVRALRAGRAAAAARSVPMRRRCVAAAGRRHPDRQPESLHEHRTDHRRRRDPLGQAPGQAPAQGHRTAGARGLALSWARYVGDDRPRITAALRDAFASGDLVFCCGGIGATPDDHTRQCAAAALGRAAGAAPAGRGR